jgi:anhydro-N-acetylmuramic acid kinase
VPVKGTLQIGETAIVRERTGLPVIGNVRARDMAAGGEGAPLAPYLDAIAYRSETTGRIVQNIGGIGNATVIPAGAGADGCFAFDTGPGNMVIDALVRDETGGAMQFDAGGAIAAQGHADEGLVAAFFNADSYFKRIPPKSTGREVYGAGFAARFRAEGRRRGLSFEDLVASATALTAVTIVRSYRDFIFPKYSIGDVIVAGGGAHNEALLAMMRLELPPSCRLSTSEQFGIPDDAREAIAFAVIGHESLMGRPSNLPAVTGAVHAAILGNITC